MKDQCRQNWKSTTPKSLILVRDKLCVPRGFVYVFAARTFIKIGKTEFSVYRRWHSIKTGNPWLEPPLYVSPPLFALVGQTERACHAELRQHRVSGEWFDCPRELAIATVRRLSHDRETPSPGEESAAGREV